MSDGSVAEEISATASNDDSVISILETAAADIIAICTKSPVFLWSFPIFFLLLQSTREARKGERVESLLEKDVY
jgi:hypothetical protein